MGLSSGNDGRRNEAQKGRAEITGADMSYCRFSSMNWKCDVYVYADASGGFTTHIARRKRIFPPIPDFFNLRLPTFGSTWDRESSRLKYPSRWQEIAAHYFYSFISFWHNRVHMASLRLIPLRPIGLPHDGGTFNDETASECADRLESLRQAGYVVPQYAIDSLREEDGARELPKER